MSAANEWHVEFNMRREIPYLQVTIYYFVYRINTIAYYWEGKPTSLMNENKWIDNPGITIVECNDKTNNGCNFQFTKFLFIDFVPTDRRSLSGKRPKSASDKSSSCRFSFSAERNANTKASSMHSTHLSSIFPSVVYDFLSLKCIWHEIFFTVCK